MGSISRPLVMYAKVQKFLFYKPRTSSFKILYHDNSFILVKAEDLIVILAKYHRLSSFVASKEYYYSICNFLQPGVAVLNVISLYCVFSSTTELHCAALRTIRLYSVAVSTIKLYCAALSSIELYCAPVSAVELHCASVGTTELYCAS